MEHAGRGTISDAIFVVFALTRWEPFGSFQQRRVHQCASAAAANTTSAVGAFIERTKLNAIRSATARVLKLCGARRAHAHNPPVFAASTQRISAGHDVDHGERHAHTAFRTAFALVPFDSKNSANAIAVDE